MMQSISWRIAALALALGLAAPLAAEQCTGKAHGTPKEMVAAYDSLASTILAVNQSERELVHAILATSYGHAQAEIAHAREALKLKPKAKDIEMARMAIENAAAAVGQIATEGDNAVAAVRKRLLEGGHHANAEGEKTGDFEEGYVVVSKAAKKAFLAASNALAKVAATPKLEGLDVEWKQVEAAWAEHIAKAK